MPKIRFTEDTLFENEGRGKGTEYVEGEVIECDEAVAYRWERRSKAERVSDSTRVGKPRKKASDNDALVKPSDDGKKPAEPSGSDDKK